MTVPADYLAFLATGATTRARCWRVTRRDGAVLGFTDHDRPLAFAGVTYEPSAAVAPSETSATLGLAPDDQEIVGALSSSAITEADLAAGRYDGAEVRIHDVDWTDPSRRFRVGVYVLGEVERTDATFRAEIRSRSSTLSRRVGRHVLPVCDAEVGDSRCGLVLEGGPFLRSAAVASVGASALDFTADGIAEKRSGFFARGVLTWTSGANAGSSSVVRDDVPSGSGRYFALWRAPSAPVAPGDAFDVVAGCAKTWGDCVAKFGNGANFRGFPHVPSERYPVLAASRSRSAEQDGKTGNRKPEPVDPVFQDREPDGGGGL